MPVTVDVCSPGQQCDGDTLCFKHKVKTLQFGTGAARQRMWRDLRDERDGHRIKVTKDEATTRGNLTVEHATKDDRVDVTIRPDVTVNRVDKQEYNAHVAQVKEQAREMKDGSA